MRQVGQDEVPGSERLWKYFRPDRFTALLATKSVYFASANQFNDAFEGAVAVQMTKPTDPRYSEMEAGEQAFFQLKRLTKICCWHRAEYESDAMWKLYAGEHKGIAICTTPDRIRAAFKPFRIKPEYQAEDLYAGPVKYIDLTQVRMKGISMLDRFYLKHRAFEWEREYRLAISLRTAEEFGVAVPEFGIGVEADTDQLIERIVVGSTMNVDERDALGKIIEEAGLRDRMQLSSLLGIPRFI